VTQRDLRSMGKESTPFPGHSDWRGENFTINVGDSTSAGVRSDEETKDLRRECRKGPQKTIFLKKKKSHSFSSIPRGEGDFHEKPSFGL